MVMFKVRVCIGVRVKSRLPTQKLNLAFGVYRLLRACYRFRIHSHSLFNTGAY